MSQQGPGGYGGGGPYGPPGGGGYPPGGGGPPAGYPPGGHGPPGYGPAGGVPPGYGAAPPGYGGSPPPKPNRALLWVGLGCGALLLLGVAGGIAAYLFVQGKANDAESAIAAAASAGTVAPGVPASGTCGKAQACCEVLASKNGNAVLAKQACAAYGKLADSVCAQQYAALKQAAVALGGRCE